MWVPYASTCTGSSRPSDALPVRSPPSSCLSNWIAPCMRRLSSLMSCVGFAMASLEHWSIRRACAGTGSIADDGGAPFPAQHRSDRSFFADREHDDRHPVLPSKREGGTIHYFQIALERLLMRQAIVALGIAILLRIGAVDTVDVGGLEHGLRTEFGRPQHGGGVRREERIAGSCRQQHHPSLLDVAQRTAPLVGLANLRHVSADMVRAGNPAPSIALSSA